MKSGKEGAGIHGYWPRLSYIVVCVCILVVMISGKVALLYNKSLVHLENSKNTIFLFTS
jgi:hypothetical protein